MNFNTIMIYTALLFLIVSGVLGFAIVMYPPLFLPGLGAWALLIVGQFVVTHYQVKHRERARDFLRVYTFPVAGMAVLVAWLIYLARHQQLITGLK